MASPADAVAQANGLVDPSLAAAAQPPSDPDPSQIAGPTAKRKRETTDDGFHQDLDIPSDAKPITNGDHTYRDEKSLIRDYYHVLQRYATAKYHLRLTCSTSNPSCTSLSIITTARLPCCSNPDMTRHPPYSNDHYQIPPTQMSQTPRDKSRTKIVSSKHVSTTKSIRMHTNFWIIWSST